MSIEIAIRTNSMAYAEDFRRINEDWISANFWLEESDIQVSLITNFQIQLHASPRSINSPPV